jgi:basic membrane protein A
MKLITPGVADILKMTKEGNFPAGNFFGTVGLAPFHDFDSKVSADIKAKLEEIDAGLQDGSISTGYAS